MGLNFNNQLIRKYVFGMDAINITQLTQHQSLDFVINFIKNEYKYFRPAPIRFLLSLYRYLLASTEAYSDLEKKTTFIIHFCCWGDSYAEKVKNYLLPSLLSAGNLPAVTKNHKTTVLIHCDSKTKRKLMRSAVMKSIKSYAKVEFIVIPRKLLKFYNASLRYPKSDFFQELIALNANLKYFFLGGLQTLALEIAMKNKCYVSFLMPDFVVSDDFLTKMFLNIQDKKMVLATGFRTDYQKVMSGLNQFFSDSKKLELAVPAPMLTELKIKHIHAAAQRRVISANTLNYDLCAQMLFETSNGFVVRTFHLHPILLDCVNYVYHFKKDYYPIDNTILAQALTNDTPFEQQAYICDNASTIAFMELSDTDMYTLPADRVVKYTYDEIVSMARNMIISRPDVYDLPLNHYFSAAKIKFESPSVHKTGDFTPDETFFADLEKCVTANKATLIS